jgi:cobalt-precorrin-5B (C1)-methyltransferase
MDTPKTPLKRGWTTGACATAAAKAAFIGLTCGETPAMVEITLPGGQTPSFAVAQTGEGFAAVIKDAGDDPDVTHLALVCATLRKLPSGSGIVFKAGKGVGTVTKPGLPLGVGEPAINPVPRQMMMETIAETAANFGVSGDVEIEISVPNGEELATKTMNPRLGIVGGISILGTTGIVIPYSCAAWIHSIHRGIDVARATGISHVAGATGNTSEAAVQRLHALPESALIDMGDFAGGMLKYIKKHPVQKVTIAGGFGKMTKLAQGMLDLHSRAGVVDMEFLARAAREANIAVDVANANSAKHVLDMAGDDAPKLAGIVAQHAWQTAAKALEGTGIALEVTVFDREGKLLAGTGFRNS